MQDPDDIQMAGTYKEEHFDLDSSKNPGVVDLIMLYLISNRLDCIKGLAGGM